MKSLIFLLLLTTGCGFVASKQIVKGQIVGLLTSTWCDMTVATVRTGPATTELLELHGRHELRIGDTGVITVDREIYFLGCEVTHVSFTADEVR